MARQYGTKLGGAWVGIGAAVALGALSVGAVGQPAGPDAAATMAPPTDPWHETARRTMDEWDERFLDLLEFICMFFDCGSSPAAGVSEAELQSKVELFIAQVRGRTVPTGSAQSTLDAVLIAVEEARAINGAQPLLPAWLAADLDAVLADLQEQLEAALEDQEVGSW